MSGIYCPICGAINGHVNGCPEAPQPEPLYYCCCCEEPIYKGDKMYIAGNDIYCTDCCGLFEAEEPD